MGQLKSLMEIVKKDLDASFTKAMYGHDENVNILEFNCLCQTPLKLLLRDI